MRGEDLVVKPTVSGGAWNTVRGVAGDAAFERAVAALPRGYDYFVQAFVPEIARDGEYSHAILKRAASGEFRVQSQFGGSVDPAEPSTGMLESAGRILAAVSALGFEGHAYARVDGVLVDGRFRLMELEMIEPALFLSGRPDAAERFARRLRQRL
jgi:glutathione synthase/RimK-type ligase-like ATP-grasp enzyme